MRTHVEVLLVVDLDAGAGGGVGSTKVVYLFVMLGTIKYVTYYFLFIVVFSLSTTVGRK